MREGQPGKAPARLLWMNNRDLMPPFTQVAIGDVMEDRLPPRQIIEVPERGSPACFIATVVTERKRRSPRKNSGV